jgi:sRNA-binding carbon storage regulator CsrA
MEEKEESALCVTLKIGQHLLIGPSIRLYASPKSKRNAIKLVIMLPREIAVERTREYGRDRQSLEEFRSYVDSLVGEP